MHPLARRRRRPPGDRRRQCLPSVPAGSPAAVLREQAQTEATFLASADLRFAAWFLWMTPLLTALSSLRDADRSAEAAFSASPDSTAARTERARVRSSLLIALF